MLPNCIKLSFVLTLLSLCGFVSAYTPDNLPNPRERNAKAFVSNPDGVLKSETEDYLNVYLDSLEKQTTAQVAVVAINTIGDADIEDFAMALSSKWKVGQKDKNNGVLILLVTDIKKISIETGYGSEGILPDALCKEIQLESMVPEFKKGDYDAGIIAGVRRMAGYIRKEPVEQTPPAYLTIPWNELIPMAAALFLLLAVISFLWMGQAVSSVKKNQRLNTNISRFIALRNNKRGIVGVMSLLLTVVGFIAILVLSKPFYLLLLIPAPLAVLPAVWMGNIQMKRMRRAPLPCPECNGTMRFLSEKEEDKYLKLSQQFEEQLHAVDYDVFVCDHCKNEAIFTLDKTSAYSKCPKCGTKAYILDRKYTMVAPTYLSAGVERVVYKCKFCGYEHNDNNNIPRLDRAAAGAFVGGSLMSGRGGFGGGGFSGGGSFGGGSFGGGSFGGGGATSGW